MSGVISTRNGVPPEEAMESDPPGGVPRIPDPDPEPHQQPGTDLPDNEPPPEPPRREASRSHHKHK